MGKEEIVEKKKQLGNLIKENRELSGLSRLRLSHLSKVQKKYIVMVENGNAYIRRGFLFRIAEYLVLTRQERIIFFAIIEQFCSTAESEIQRNYSKKARVFPRKRPGTPIDIRSMRITRFKNCL